MSANLEVGKHSHKCCHGDGVRIDEAIARYERMTEMAEAEYEKWKSKALSLEDLSSSTPYITEDGGNVIFNYFTPKQMAEVYIWLDGGNLHFELTKDEEGQYSLTTKSDIQELDGMFIVGGEEFIVNTIVDSFIVDLKGHKVSEVRIEGIDADLLNADFTWKLAEIGNKLDNIKLPEIDTTELAKQGDNPEATNSKILNAIQDIVGTGLLANEEVKVKVSIPNSEEFDWNGYAVILTDKSANTQEVKNLNADGTCTFNVPIGHSYEIGFPQLTTYVTPMKQTYVAIQRERYVVHEYAEPDGIEVLKITVMSQLSGGTSTILDGSALSVTDTDGEVYSGVVNGYECHISIPYGKTYTLVQPFIEGYRSESGSVTYTALAPTRNVTLRYSEDGYGVFGVDDEGKLYTIDEIEAMHDKTIIKYGFYNDLELASASRIDSGFGNGFYWELGKESLGSMQWAAKNVAFDTSRLPYFSNDAAASKATAGAYYTKVIEEVGPSVIADSANPTPAASACLSKTVYFGGKEHQGFLPAYGQIKKITTNRTLFQAFYSALGRTAPAIWSGDWWASCQSRATDAVLLAYGGFASVAKSSRYQVFCCFDL